MSTRAQQTLGHEVDRQDPSRAAVLRDPGAHLADRAKAEHERRLSGWDVGVFDGLPRGGQYIGEVDEAVVGRPPRAP
jgi:hypothetical protein